MYPASRVVLVFPPEPVDMTPDQMNVETAFMSQSQITSSEVAENGHMLGMLVGPECDMFGGDRTASEG